MIEESAFTDCGGLESVTIPTTLKTVEIYAFYHCASIKAVHISSLAAWCDITFQSNVSNPLSYAEWLYLNGEQVTNVSVPQGCLNVRSFAFYNYDKLESVILPASVTEIGNYTFTNCSAIKELYFGSGITEIGVESLYGCTGLEKIYYAGTEAQWNAITIGEKNSVSSNVQLIFLIGT